ncbi:hypothetical protein ACF8PL_20230 [Delftia sp. WSY_4]|uniref:hypothetical protein n=1 Tax=Delftia TaxID=80865 RepID=UPI001EDD36E2|nr:MULTISPECIES: hypothetical protein [Delftia]MCG3784798.1 hypothetical protein [Delftia acidovorans]MDH0849220.1 hypothetical protein [Delftia tsuruhatensis]
MNLADLTDAEKVPLLLEMLEEAGEQLDRAWPAGGRRYLSAVREMRGDPEDPE